MKNFLLADSSELIAVRLFSLSWAQEQVIPTLYTWCTSSSWKIFFSPIGASWCLLDSFWHPEPKNKWFLLCKQVIPTFVGIYKVGITCFWAKDAKTSLTAISSLESARKKFFELDVHHVYKVGITCFWAQDAKMSLTAISSLESARRKFFMKSTYIMSTK